MGAGNRVRAWPAPVSRITAEYRAPTRLTELAADHLRNPDMTVGAIDLVGYETPFALSNAFERVRGISPRQHRELITA